MADTDDRVVCAVVQLQVRQIWREKHRRPAHQLHAEYRRRHLAPQPGLKEARVHVSDPHEIARPAIGPFLQELANVPAEEIRGAGQLDNRLDPRVADRHEQSHQRSTAHADGGNPARIGLWS